MTLFEWDKLFGLLAGWRIVIGFNSRSWSKEDEKGYRAIVKILRLAKKKDQGVTRKEE